MIDLAAIRVAVVADTSLQRHILQQFLLKKGYQVVLNSNPQHLSLDSLQACQTDLWLYDALFTEEDCIALEYFLSEPNAPVLFGEGSAPERSSEDYPRWERSLLKKIMHLTSHLEIAHVANDASLAAATNAILELKIELPQRFSEQQCVSDQPAQQVWLLAASTGGPQAVKAFLDVLPKGLPIGFIYAQHIDANFEANLPQAVGRHSEWPVRLLDAHPFVREGEVVIVPVRHELNFTDTGCMQQLQISWRGPYSPSVEQMMCNLAQHYEHNCGVIVFSGMGSDGSIAAAYVNQQGAPVWTQDAESCACSSMPDSVRNAGYSSLSATPTGLAHALVQYVLNQYTQHNDDAERKIS